MTNDDIARLRALVEDTKTGPWSRESGHVLIAESDEWPAFDINLLPGKNRQVAVALARYFAAVSPTAIRSLLDELEKARADSERYRWLRDNLDSDWAICEWDSTAYDGAGFYRDARAPEIVDAAIDQARAAQQGEQP